MPADLAHYTITGAQDWPMFKEMLAGMRILAGLFCSAMIAGGGLMWRDLRNRISTQRSEDKAGCIKCQATRDFALKEVWDTIDVIAPRHPKAAGIIAAAKKRYQGASPGGGCTDGA